MSIKLPSWLRRLWLRFSRPSSLALGVILLMGFVAGVVFWGGFNTSMEMSNTEEFCIGCHEMRDNVFEEYQQTVHYNNRSGVRAICSDCHVPKDWTHKMVRKIQASKELWGKMTGVVDTPEKFNLQRLAMAQREWARMKASDSRECRNCHELDSMDLSMQRPIAQEMHTKAVDEGLTCIDCHKGIAHRLPDMHNVAMFGEPQTK